VAEIGWTYRVLMVPLIVATLVLYVAPLISMLSLAVLDPSPGIENFAWIADSTATWSILKTTLRISLIAAALSVLLGYLVSYVIWLLPNLLGRLMLATVLVSFWLSVLVRCFALLMTFGNRGPLNQLLLDIGIVAKPMPIMRNEIGVVIGMIYYLMPYAVLTLLSAMQGIDMALLGAARSLGAGKARIFYRIVVPLSANGIFAAFGICFILSLGFYITPALLGGGRVVMIAEFITFFVSNVLAWGKAAALALVLTLSIAVGWLLVRLIERARTAEAH
jgi:putative spermidine/putrescine transport system permease protein